MYGTIISILKSTFLFRIYKKNQLKKIEQEKKIRNRYFILEGEKLLVRFANILNENNILFWLDFGTLLGYYRENDFIKHDDDLDIGAWLSDAHRIREILLQNGFILVSSYASTDGGKEECYRYKHTCIDIFYYREKSNNTIYCNAFITKRSLFKISRHRNCVVEEIEFPYNGFDKVLFKGVYVNVPRQADKYLVCHYGASFMTPDPGFNSKDVATNVTFLDYPEYKGVLEIYSSKLG